ncbi:hypothetical protein PPERSA_03133 [Pseudocohnilembus persalinus]|uniref:Uncharacterized protein n=1 Tax=Pseudocohnilembus persalinus TaxID=266149 RepID=A0A0V0QIS2_PSEPJ|nr:hypothetical protein PPERSA_03133 [Pseudocohnilembus persalinus]|eukprot:KRX02071.1 hypothetical protein PPERSA_03133 [Pseudocohnilembus persalinus]
MEMEAIKNKKQKQDMVQKKKVRNGFQKEEIDLERHKNYPFTRFVKPIGEIESSEKSITRKHHLLKSELNSKQNKFYQKFSNIPFYDYQMNFLFKQYKQRQIEQQNQAPELQKNIGDLTLDQQVQEQKRKLKQIEKAYYNYEIATMNQKRKKKGKKGQHNFQNENEGQNQQQDQNQNQLDSDKEFQQEQKNLFLKMEDPDKYKRRQEKLRAQNEALYGEINLKGEDDNRSDRSEDSILEKQYEEKKEFEEKLRQFTIDQNKNQNKNIKVNNEGKKEIENLNQNQKQNYKKLNAQQLDQKNKFLMARQPKNYLRINDMQKWIQNQNRNKLNKSVNFSTKNQNQKYQKQNKNSGIFSDLQSDGKKIQELKANTIEIKERQKSLYV